MKWFPLSKGGSFRKWFGNNEYVINYWNDGYDIKKYKKDKLDLGLIEKKNSQCWNEVHYFKEGLTYSRISSSNFSVRYNYYGHIFDTAAPMLFVDEDIRFYIMAFLNSNQSKELNKILSPTLTFQSGDIQKLPILIIYDEDKKSEIKHVVKTNIKISKLIS